MALLCNQNPSHEQEEMTLVARCLVPPPLRGAAQWQRQRSHTAGE